MQEMRRKKRALPLEGIKEVVARETVLRIGLFDEKFPYVVPVNYGYEWQGEQLILYVHGAHEGKKISCIKKNPNICIEIDGEHGLIETGLRAEGYSFAYESVIGYGQAEIIEDRDEKLKALELLMINETGKDLSHFNPIPENMIKGTAIIKLIISEITGKHHHGPHAKPQ